MIKDGDQRLPEGWADKLNETHHVCLANQHPWVNHIISWQLKERIWLFEVINATDPRQIIRTAIVYCPFCGVKLT